MATSETITSDPAKLAVFANDAENVIPDPAVYSDWFAAAGERRQRLAVGTRRYSAMKDLTGRLPQWAEFINPETGELLPLRTLRGESAEERAARTGEVQRLVAERGQAIRQTATFGFLR